MLGLVLKNVCVNELRWISTDEVSFSYWENVSSLLVFSKSETNEIDTY